MSRQCKKKLAPLELFAYRLCFGLKQWEHPDAMLAEMPWEWFAGWLAYYNDEPWGEIRADQRTAAQTMYLKSPIQWQPDALPEMEYPYFAQSNMADILLQKAVLDQRKDEFNAKRKAKAEQLESLS